MPIQLIVTANYSGELKPDTIQTIEISVKAIMKAYGFTDTTVTGTPASREIDQPVNPEH